MRLFKYFDKQHSPTLFQLELQSADALVKCLRCEEVFIRVLSKKLIFLLPLLPVYICKLFGSVVTNSHVFNKKMNINREGCLFEKRCYFYVFASFYFLSLEILQNYDVLKRVLK